MKRYICTLYIHTSFMSKLPGFCCGCREFAVSVFVLARVRAFPILHFHMLILCTYVYDSIMRFAAHKGAQWQLFFIIFIPVYKPSDKDMTFLKKRSDLIYSCIFIFIFAIIFIIIISHFSIFFSHKAVLIKILHK